jgi:hypothetical protein
MRLPFVSRRYAHGAIAVATAGLRADLEATQAELADLRAEAAKREQQAADEQPPAAVEHTELWSLIDWSLWGSGMGDTFREQLADQFIAAITPEQHAQALELIRWWTEDCGREPLGRRRYEDQQRRLHRALRACARYRAQLAIEKRVVRRLGTQLLDAPGYQGKSLFPAARTLLDLDQEDPK